MADLLHAVTLYEICYCIVFTFICGLSSHGGGDTQFPAMLSVHYVCMSYCSVYYLQLCRTSRTAAALLFTRCRTDQAEAPVQVPLIWEGATSSPLAATC